MFKAGWKQRSIAGTTRTASAAAIGAMLICNCISASAEQMQAPASKAAELETAFWTCDHAAIKGLIAPNQAATCSAITDELKREKFGGDFEKLLAWWRQNKMAQHQELDRASTVP